MLTKDQTVKYVFDSIRFCPSKKELSREGDYKGYYSSLDKSSFRLSYFTAVIFCALSAFSWPHFESIGRICMQLLSGLTVAVAVIGLFITFVKFNAKKYYFSTILSSFCLTTAMILIEWAFAVNLKPSPLLSLPFLMIPAIAVLLFRDFFLRKAGAEFSRKQRIIRIISYLATFAVAAAVLIYCLATAENRDSTAVSSTLLTMVLSAVPAMLLSDIFKLYHLARLERSGVDINKLDPIIVRR